MLSRFHSGKEKKVKIETKWESEGFSTFLSKVVLKTEKKNEIGIHRLVETSQLFWKKQTLKKHWYLHIAELQGQFFWKLNKFFFIEINLWFLEEPVDHWWCVQFLQFEITATLSCLRIYDNQWTFVFVLNKQMKSSKFAIFAHLTCSIIFPWCYWDLRGFIPNIFKIWFFVK